MRPRTIVAAASLALALSGCSQANNGSASTTANDAVIVVPYTIESGKSRADALKAIGGIGESIKS